MRSLPWLLSLLFAASVLHAQSSSFQPSFQVTQFPTGCPSNAAPVQIFTGDFNGDHITDLVIACGANPAAFSIDQFSVLLGKGDGTFQAPIVTSIASTPVHIYTSGLPAITAMDVNGDGKTDLVFSATGPVITVISNPFGSVTSPSWTVTVLLSQGNGTFAPADTLATSLPYAVWGAADLNGDGIPDLVLMSEAGTGFEVMFGKGNGTFSSPAVYSVPSGQIAEPVAMADFNGDGKPDVITSDTVNSLSIWLNQGDGSFGPPVVAASLNAVPGQTLAGDFNGDGKLDLGVNATYFNVILGNGDGAFQTPKQTIPMYGTALFGLDLNQDGRTDLVQQAGNIGGVIFYLAQADGTFESLSTLNLPIPVLVADFNGDGKPDMAGWTAFSGSYDQVSVMINTTVINATTGAANGASFVPSQPLTGGAVASVFGTGFAASDVYASAIPLPATLGKVSVTIGGFPAPLLFVSAKQINLQVPWEVSGTTADIVVTANGTALAPFDAPIGPLSPGIFTAQSGTGQAIAINPDGSLAGPEGSIPGTALHPAKVGDPLVILATGLGPVTPKIADGHNASDALRNTIAKPAVLIGGEPADVQFSGLSPQFVGLNQINVTVPQVKAGVVPLQLSIGGITTSNKVTIAVESK